MMKNMDKIKVLVVDDEKLAREGLAELIGSYDDLTIVSLCSSGIEAFQTLNESQIDLLFLDIQMPGIDGFDLLNMIPKNKRPMVVFITAYDDYAIRAFDYRAIDYILKPFTNQRFSEMIDKVRHLMRSSHLISQLDKIDQVIHDIHKTRYMEHELFTDKDSRTGHEMVVIKQSGEIKIIPANAIVYIEAYDYYIKIHEIKITSIARIPLKEVIDQLPSDNFIRIHRGSIINLNYLQSIEKKSSKDYYACLKNNTRLKISQTYRKDLEAKLNL